MSTEGKDLAKPDISIVVTAHREGLVAHKTMRSIERACSLLDVSCISYEILVSIDKGDDATKAYFKKREENQALSIYEWDFGDLGKSRNAVIEKASGKYISLIDADDLMSEKWLLHSFQYLEKKPYGSSVAHSAYTIEFGDADSVIVKYGTTNRDQDILLSVWSGRWNSVIIAPRLLFERYKYSANSSGFGYEDWHMSCNFIKDGIENILIPETAIFVRRKLSGSEWLRQKTARSLLHAHPIFLPSSMQKISMENINFPKTPSQEIIKTLAKKYHLPLSKARPAISLARKLKAKLTRGILETTATPKWLVTEWHSLHTIEKKIFPPQTYVANYHTITNDHYLVGAAYHTICKGLERDQYDYVLFVPWLIPGGADLFAVNYANTASSLGQSVLVIATNESTNESTWSSRLQKDVDFVDFGKITLGMSLEHKMRLLEQLVENTGIKNIHILNSELGYEFVKSHESYITATSKRIIATAYSQSTDKSQRIFGFSHTHIPEIFHLIDTVTTDNSVVRDMWVNEYSFDPSKIVIHHQPIDSTGYSHINLDRIPSKKILWAARLAPEKMPNIIHEISDLLPSDTVIHMYGSPSPEFSVKDLITADRVVYKGAFSSIADIPVEDYDLYLYTSLFDGTPNTPIEISMTGLPIVASAVGGLPEFIETDGFLVTDNLAASYVEAILSAYKDYSRATLKAQKLERRARDTFSRRQFSDEVSALLDIDTNENKKLTE